MGVRKKRPYKRNPTGNSKAKQMIGASLDYETALILNLLCMAENRNKSAMVSKTIHHYWEANKKRVVDLDPEDARLGFRSILEKILEK